MLSIQTRYTPTVSKVDNDKQIPQLLLIVLSRCSNIVVLQQTQQPAIVSNNSRTANEDDEQQLRNLFIVIHLRSGGSISWLNTQHDTWNSN
ncbi:hypothetical protein F511_11827 [Dorcoceras hygrometricum]|uniref:Uncharacterized protein n=1 Tax=Dorcoceras hygrometricum TaxID=472368 RepID=A0A2Z7AUN7_9LAMI|nr:hypothetical protein F511_11827 [Dorcoceras hygrometricum]